MKLPCRHELPVAGVAEQAVVQRGPVLPASFGEGAVDAMHGQATNCQGAVGVAAFLTRPPFFLAHNALRQKFQTYCTFLDCADPLSLALNALRQKFQAHRAFLDSGDRPLCPEEVHCPLLSNRCALHFVFAEIPLVEIPKSFQIYDFGSIDHE